MEEVLQQRDRLWPQDPRSLGIDFNDESHQRILLTDFPKYIGDYDYPEHVQDDGPRHGFYTQNSQFGWLDARALFVLLRSKTPRRIVEVGSGFSSLLMADINERFAARSIGITCIEPYPREFLVEGVPGIGNLLVKKVQDVAFDVFDELAGGDVLFIDSSHVAKTGSDVNFLYFEVLPRLAKGVRIHIHDIFLPFEYLQDWVVNERRSWNEQYLVRALLMYSNRFRVAFGSSYAFHKYPDLVKTALNLPGGEVFGGASLWIEVV